MMRQMTSPPLSWASKVTRVDPSDWSQPKVEDLGGPPIPDLQVAEFLSGEGPPWSGEKQEDDPGQQEYSPETLFQQCLCLGCMVGQTD